MGGTKHYILGVHVTDRVRRAGDVQSIFTEFGCNIKSRIGLHDVSADDCAPTGVILLELFGDEGKCRELEARLAAVEGVEVKKMVFEHPRKDR